MTVNSRKTAAPVLKIRPMRGGDKAPVMKILRRTPEFKAAEVVVAEEVIDGCRQGPEKSGYYALVAEDDGKIAGYICYGPTPLTEGTWDIYWEAVAPESRGQGVGSALMRAAEGEIRRAGGRLALIETSSKPEYEATRRFHAKQGYGLIARVPDFYAPGDDRLILQKMLKD